MAITLNEAALRAAEAAFNNRDAGTFRILSEAILAYINAMPSKEAEAEADRIVTSLYLRFKDWSKREFGPDDVTWCEVKADVMELVALAHPPTDAGVSEALRCLEELANMPLGISLEDWCRVSGPILAALSIAVPAGDGVPPGMVLVPREPTPEMLGAWYRYKNGHHYHDEPIPGDTSDVGAYRAMVSAALSATSTAGKG